MQPSSFSIGDKAVYPAHGVAEVLGIETREISGSKQIFYILRILENGLRIMIPAKNLGTVGLRRLVTSNEVEEVYEILRCREISHEVQPWSRRYREYMEKIKTGSVFEIAEVIRDLSLRKGDKELSFGERKMLGMARGLLVKELALAEGTNETRVQERLDQIFTC